MVSGYCPRFGYSGEQNIAAARGMIGKHFWHPGPWIYIAWL